MSLPHDRLSEAYAKLRHFRRALRIKAAYRETFESPAGTLVLRDLLRRAGALETSMEPGDPGMTAFREGRRSLALDVLQQLRWSEGELAQLARERDPDALSAVTDDAEAA